LRNIDQQFRNVKTYAAITLSSIDNVIQSTRALLSQRTWVN
jgi:hypothetical protein